MIGGSFRLVVTMLIATLLLSGCGLFGCGAFATNGGGFGSCHAGTTF